jgi:ribulose-5-phosphate 4-epimerase/fuculose-1-phosphate aldolase
MSKIVDEGYIKFNANWKKSLPIAKDKLENLQHWRNQMYAHHLIGAYPNGIGFGNISERTLGDNQFYISGSATGNFSHLTNEHYARVIDFDLLKNRLTCRGPIVASSESMSHAVIYQECPWVNGVIHIHHLDLWKKLLHQVPTTDQSATYGTPEMAFSIIDLLKKTDLPSVKIFVMEGHEEGIFAFGKDLDEAGKIIFKWLERCGL